jgi:hypothetical protein
VTERLQELENSFDVASKKNKQEMFLIQPDHLLDTGGQILDFQKKVNIEIDTDIFISYQRIAVSVIQHLAKHKDIRLARNMLDRMPKELLDVNSMKVFLERFSHVRILTETDTLKGKFKGLEKGGMVVFDSTKKIKLADALETPWWKFS